MNIFICTKPLQIMTCMIIASNTKKHTLIIVDLFKDAKTVSLSEKLNKYFSNIVLVKSRNEALKLCEKLKPTTLFIDSDIGLIPLIRFYRLKLFSRNTSISVYEEGIGTYRQNLFKNPIKKLLYNSIGAATYFGGCALTTNIHVYDLDHYKKKFPSSGKKPLRIRQDLTKWIGENELELTDIFSPNFKIPTSPKNTETSVYLSSWDLDRELINKLSKNKKLYIKPHPHIKEEVKKTFSNNPNIHFFPAQIPAELIIMKLSAAFDKITIYHHNSSALHYLTPTNVTSMDIDSPPRDHS